MNKYTRSQFVYSTYGKPVMIAGTMVLAVPVQASLVNQGVTITSDVLGSAGNSITYAVTGGGTAGSEVVTVSGNAISIQIQSGVSTVTQVRTALNASTEAAALITASGTSGSAVTAPVAATALSGGVDGVSSSNFGSLVASAVRTGVGTFLITFSDQYNNNILNTLSQGQMSVFILSYFIGNMLFNWNSIDFILNISFHYYR